MSTSQLSKAPVGIIKVCGNVSIENIKRMQPLIPDWLGFIFYPPSPRYFKDAPEAIAGIPQTKVGVFVDMPYEKIVGIANRAALDYLQLHGNESADYCKRLKKHYSLIKAFGIDENFDFNRLRRYEKYVDFFLFDTAGYLKGGSGKKFDRNLIKQYTLSTPYILSGGIDLQEALSLLKSPAPNMAGIDVNSKFEHSPGIKNNTLIQQLLSSAHYDNREA